MKKLLIALLSLLILSPVYAENWVKVTSDLYGDSHSFYKTGIDSAGMTFRIRNYKYYPWDKKGVLGEGISYRIDKIEANCEKRLVKRVKSTSYDSDNNIVLEKGESRFGPVSPYTLGDRYLEGVCYVLGRVDGTTENKDSIKGLNYDTANTFNNSDTLKATIAK